MYAFFIFVFLCLFLFTLITYYAYKEMQKDDAEIHRLAAKEKKRRKGSVKKFSAEHF